MIYNMTYVVEKSPWDKVAVDQGTGDIVQWQDLTDKTDFFYWLFLMKAEASKFKRNEEKISISSKDTFIRVSRQSLWRTRYVNMQKLVWLL